MILLVCVTPLGLCATIIATLDSGGYRGGRLWVGTSFFRTTNAFKLGHVVGNPLSPGLRTPF